MRLLFLSSTKLPSFQSFVLNIIKSIEFGVTSGISRVGYKAPNLIFVLFHYQNTVVPAW